MNVYILEENMYLKGSHSIEIISNSCYLHGEEVSARISLARFKRMCQMSAFRCQGELLEYAFLDENECAASPA